jgi:hypothetical protein
MPGRHHRNTHPASSSFFAGPYVELFARQHWSGWGVAFSSEADTGPAPRRWRSNSYQGKPQPSVVAVLEWAEKLIEKPTFRWAIGSTARQNSRERRCSSPSGGMSSGIRAVVAQPLAAAGDRRGSAMGAGRVKTCASQESVESFSLVPSSDSRRQHFLFSE